MANRLKEIRKSKGMSGETLGKRMGEVLGEDKAIGKAMVSKLEKGKAKLTDDYLRAAAEVLNCTTDDILGKTKTPLYPQNKPSTGGFGDGGYTGRETDLIPVFEASGSDGERIRLATGDLPESFIPRHPKQRGVDGAFAVRIIGESMAPRFHHGEYAYVKPRHTPAKGDDCLVVFKDGEGIVKKLKSLNAAGAVFLQHNPAKTLSFSATEIADIWPIVGR